MHDAVEKLDKFIRNNERVLLRGKGSISKQAADQFAKEQYRIFNEERRRLRHEHSMNED
jgi:hypothetical protein